MDKKKSLIWIGLCGIAAIFAFYYFVLFGSHGGGFGETSPDGKYTMLITGGRKKVEIVLSGPSNQDEMILTYMHNADPMYFRGRGNKVLWSKDSIYVHAIYDDIIEDKEMTMHFEYDLVEGNWKLSKTSEDKNTIINQLLKQAGEQKVGQK